MRALASVIEEWIAHCSPELHDALRWQFFSGSKYFRPLTVFSCRRAMQSGEITPEVIESALLIELIHNVSLVVDDIVDMSDERRGRPALHRKFGQLHAFMASGYVVAEGFRKAAADPGLIELLAELLKRLAVAECMQWRLRRRPLGLEDWRIIAGEDTGAMFEVAACFGDRTQRLRKFGGLLGLLYHGCDDVADVRGTTALGGGGFDDLRDGILTLPAALAIGDPVVARAFADPAASPLDDGLAFLAEAFRAKLPEAEAWLDRIADEARTEAHLFATDPTPLLALVERTRALSAR
ncbi:MAG TPA: polyprenyl synthetase family protein [Acetobacteraceae bacterium]|nr:polyprenyl synthetase family protein [Acetobacteraceae bacterium]